MSDNAFTGPSVPPGRSVTSEYSSGHPTMADPPYEPDELPRQASVRQRRQRWLLWLACGTSVVCVAGLVASLWVKSPAEIVAQTGPPTPSLITAPVSYGVLQDTVIFRGTFSAPRIVSFTPSAAVAPGGSGPASQSLVVTRVLARVGDQVGPGQVLAEVSDRPIFVLYGAVPAFRDMVQGESGADIAELQAALAELGYGISDPSGVFGPSTAAAVRQFYAASGFGVPLVSPGTAAGSAGSTSGTASGITSTPIAGTAARTAAPKTRPARRKAAKRLVEVPMSEAMFVPSFPATVTALPRLGATVAPPLVSVRVGGLQLIGQLPPAMSGQLRRGMRVQILSAITGRTTTGVVSSVGRTVVNPGHGGTAYAPVRVSSLHGWAASWDGQNVQLTVTAAATSGPVLAVPEAAISASADGVTSVTVVEHGGGTRRVRVRTGASANGLVQVTPVGAKLAPGDLVVVGG